MKERARAWIIFAHIVFALIAICSSRCTSSVVLRKILLLPVVHWSRGMPAAAAIFSHACLGELVRALDDDPVPLKKIQERQAHRVPRLADLDALEHARVAQLLQNHPPVEVLCGLEGVWLDAADVVRRRGIEHLHERVDLLLEPRRDGHQGFSGLLALHALAGADEALQEGVLGAHHQGDQVGSDRVLVLLEEAVGLVHHVPGEVGNAEGRGVETLVQKVGLALEAHVHLVHEGLVRGRLQPALLLQQAEQAGPFAHAPLLLDQVQAGLVVVVLDGRDVDALGLVVVELVLEVVLHKLLVQLLVRIVDAELLE